MLIWEGIDRRGRECTACLSKGRKVQSLASTYVLHPHTILDGVCSIFQTKGIRNGQGLGYSTDLGRRDEEHKDLILSNAEDRASSNILLG